MTHHPRLEPPIMKSTRENTEASPALEKPVYVAMMIESECMLGRKLHMRTIIPRNIGSRYLTNEVQHVKLGRTVRDCVFFCKCVIDRHRRLSPSDDFVATITRAARRGIEVSKQNYWTWITQCFIVRSAQDQWSCKLSLRVRSFIFRTAIPIRTSE